MGAPSAGHRPCKLFGSMRKAGHGKALIVDDDAAIRILVSKFIEREGFAVDTAENGFDALRKLTETDYDVVLLDIMMPNLDGFAVIRELRNMAPQVLDRVIVMTALSPESMREQVPRVLKKPFDFRQLTALIRSYRACIPSFSPAEA